MAVLQIAMSEDRYNKVKAMLNKAQAKFQMDGMKYKYAEVFERIIEEWMDNKGLINQVVGEKVTAISMVRNDPEELDYIRGLIEQCEIGAGPGPVRDLMHIINRVDKYWRPSITIEVPQNKQVASKALELFFEVRET